MATNIGAGLFSLLLAVGCSQKSAESRPADDESHDTEKSNAKRQVETEEQAAKKQALEGDDLCDDILRSLGTLDAHDWIKRYTNTLPGGITLETVVTSLYQAQVPQINIHTNGSLFHYGIIVTLPSEPTARQKVFAIGPQLSQMCAMDNVKDHGQKYLHYVVGRFKPRITN